MVPTLSHEKYQMNWDFTFKEYEILKNENQ